MIAKCCRAGALAILCGVLAGCASAPARADGVSAPAQVTQSAQAPSAPAAAAPDAQPPTDGQTAFVEGYRAYQNHDDARAIEQLKFAAENFPALGDYALFYLARAQHDQGDLNGSAATLARMGAAYPPSGGLHSGGERLAGDFG